MAPLTRINSETSIFRRVDTEQVASGLCFSRNTVSLDWNFHGFANLSMQMVE
jgi:hypothetical protein